MSYDSCVLHIFSYIEGLFEENSQSGTSLFSRGYVWV